MAQSSAPDDPTNGIYNQSITNTEDDGNNKDNQPISLIARINTLPKELRLKILKVEMEYSIVEDCLDGTQRPSIFAALKVNPDQTLYNEFLEEHNRSHAVVHIHNEEDFNKRKMKDLLQIKHLTIIYPLTFRAQKLTIQNKVETLFLDYRYSHNDIKKLSKQLHEQGYPNNNLYNDYIDKKSANIGPTNVLDVLKFLIAANQKSSGLRKLIVRTTGEKVKLVAILSSGLKLEPQKRFHKGFVYYICKKPNDSILTWDPRVSGSYYDEKLNSGI
ncbi:uncharacterized protein LY89DRAFT_728015 [Mollisia scopiformis]|uniref:Uncharacterized protein n=1 Tax=Mollisia scopiformis TaxID=149040 RepID=A0A194XSX7_MOLSC|nr:uncharacterized protein LY89DRAFT_728015 [Mollisia scopiformis]KUJ23246.1 hypothetical protein LY89DRAFT_728015 [Mollisia scopiformis]